MKTSKTIGINALKEKLAYYLQEVQAGVFISITDKGSIIAELHKPLEKTIRERKKDLLEEWVEQGKIIMPKTEKKPLPVSPVHLKEGTAKMLLDQDRGL